MESSGRPDRGRVSFLEELFMDVLRVSRRTAVLLAFFLLTSCQSEQIDLSQIVDPVEPVSFAADVQPLFTASCGGVGCHIGESTNGVNLTTHAQVMASFGLQYNALIVVPGEPDESPLLDKLSADPRFGSRMPLNRVPLSGTEIAVVRAWIEEGALDN